MASPVVAQLLQRLREGEEWVGYKAFSLIGLGSRHDGATLLGSGGLRRCGSTLIDALKHR